MHYNLSFLISIRVKGVREKILFGKMAFGKKGFGFSNFWIKYRLRKSSFDNFVIGKIPVIKNDRYVTLT
jgi:hypothetical protein